MDVSLKTLTDLATVRTACLVLPVRQDGALTRETRRVDGKTGGQLSRLVKAEHFSGEAGKSLLLHGPQGVAAERILLIGIGKKGETDAGGFCKILGHALGVVRGTGARDAVLCISDIDTSGRDLDWQLQQTGILAKTAAYRYTRTLSKPAAAAPLKKLTVGVDGKVSKSLARALGEGRAIGDGINFARELGNLPANICTPSYLASEARSLARRHDAVSCKVLDEKQMEKLGMRALLSVAAGTRQPAKLIVLEYRGAAKSDKPYVLVGKGITFDSGGISLKPGAAMDEMKFDMCGAASVLGTMASIAKLEPRINVVGIIAASENLPSGTATKPGDVIRSMSGITIEILNTDAEGRLVLCDALTYAERFKPAAIVDIATLTGACVVALGKHASGLFSNSEELAAELLDAGDAVRDRAWRMPLWDDYQEQLKSNFADVANVGGSQAGSVTAACFLSRFTREQRWAHLDIAGSAWESGLKKGATGRPVALLSRYLLDRAETRGKRSAGRAAK